MTEQPTAVQLAIFNARTESVTRRMANTLLRTGRSGVINTARDFSCSLVTARGELLSVSEGFPIHMLRGADLMAQCMASFHPTLKRGERASIIRPVTATLTPQTIPSSCRWLTTLECTASLCWRKPILQIAGTPYPRRI